MASMGMQAKVKRQLALLIGGKCRAMVRAAGQVMPHSTALKNSKKCGLRQPKPATGAAAEAAGEEVGIEQRRNRGGTDCGKTPIIRAHPLLHCPPSMASEKRTAQWQR